MTLPATNAQSAFLTPEELRDLTGYARPSAQEAWLRARGFNVAKNGIGRVMLTWDAVVQWQLGASGQKTVVSPDWSKIA